MWWKWTSDVCAQAWRPHSSRRVYPTLHTMLIYRSFLEVSSRVLGMPISTCVSNNWRVFMDACEKYMTLLLKLVPCQCSAYLTSLWLTFRVSISRWPLQYSIHSHSGEGTDSLFLGLSGAGKIVLLYTVWCILLLLPISGKNAKDHIVQSGLHAEDSHFQILFWGL